MRNFREKMVVVLLVALMVLPLYSWMVNVVNALLGHDLIGSFELGSGRESLVASVFDIGDTLVVAAASGIGDSYELEIYYGSSSVFVQSGVFSSGSAQIIVPLNPPSFIAGRSYLVVFVAYANDYPIPGALASDTIGSSFAIVAVGTEIDLEVEYDVSSSSLVLNASLVTVDGFSVPNEGVDFALQFDKQRRTEGWVPLASVKTKSDGSARRNLAFGLPSGSYRVRAVHKGNENYGKCEVVERVTVVSNITDGTSNSTGSSGGGSSHGLGTLSLSVNSIVPYTLLPMKATSTFVANVALQGSVWILFYLDHTRSWRFLSSAKVEHNGTVPYVYETSLFWRSGVLGSHKIISGIVNGSAADLDAAIKNGAGLIDSAEVEVSFQRCPINAVLDFPDAFYGDVFPVSVAVSKPRPYEAADDGFCVTSALAPKLSYNGIQYAVDEAAAFVPVKFYVNGALVFQNFTDSRGVAGFSLGLGFNNTHVRASVEGLWLFSDAVVEADLLFRRVTVSDNVDFPGNSFSLNFSLSDAAEKGKLYIASDSQLKVEASFQNQPVWNLPVSILYGKLVSTTQTDGLGRANVPAGSDYLRVSVLGTSGGGEGGSGWENLETIDPWDPYIVFNNIQAVELDSQRFARIPVGAVNLTFCYPYRNVGATIEFFRIVREEDAVSNGFGRVEAVWIPNELGRYVVQVSLPSQFDLITSSSVDVFFTWALTNVLGYFDVVKRPVQLSLSSSPSDAAVGNPVNMIANAVDGAVNNPASNLQIQFSVNGGPLSSAYTNSSGVVVFSWTPTSHIVHNAVVSYCGNAIYEASSANSTFDLRYSTNLRVYVTVPFFSEKSLDGYICKDGMSYPPANLLVPATTCERLKVGQYMQYYPNNQIYYAIYRGYVSFNTSALPDNANVISATLKLKTYTDLTIYSTDFVVRVLGGLQPIYGSSLDSADWGVGTALVGQWNTVNYADETYIGIAIDASQVNLGGRTQFELRTSREGTAPSVAGYEEVEFYSADIAINAPYLEVTYELDTANNSTVNVNTLTNCQFRVEDLPANSLGESVNVYVDGSLNRTTQITGNAGEPVAFFNWRAVSAGVHHINVSYGGNLNYNPDSLCFAAVAEASPVSLEFSVNTTSFAPGDLVTLRAKAINPLTGQSLSGPNIEFWQDGYGYGTLVNGQYYPTENGVATTTWTYPSVGGAHTIIAKVKDGQAVANVTLAIQPITLNVGVETRLWLWVERGLTNTDHTVYARLVRADDPDCAVSNQTLKLDVGGTVYTLTTNSTGYANQSLSLVAVSGQTTTYQTHAVFEGAGFKTRNLTIPDPYGRDYAVCTTMQWDFKSSQNIVSLMVEAPKTDATVSEPASPEDNVTVTQTPETTTVTVPPPRTPEQMQAEAQQEGLQTWGPDSFTLWPPFMKFHARVLLDWLGMDIHSWIGIGGCGIDSYAGFGSLSEKVFENVPIDLVDVVTSAFISSITATTALFIASSIAATFTSVTPSYALTLLLYTGGGLAAIGAANALPNARLSRAILYGIGATLLSLIVGAYAIDLLRGLPFVIIATLTGPPYIQLAAKAIVNTLVRSGLGVASIALQLTFKNPLLIPFAVATLGLAALAIYLGWKRI